MNAHCPNSIDSDSVSSLCSSAWKISVLTDSSQGLSCVVVWVCQSAIIYRENLVIKKNNRSFQSFGKEVAHTSQPVCFNIAVCVCKSEREPVFHHTTHTLHPCARRLLLNMSLSQQCGVQWITRNAQCVLVCMCVCSRVCWLIHHNLLKLKTLPSVYYFSSCSPSLFFLPVWWTETLLLTFIFWSLFETVFVVWLF